MTYKNTARRLAVLEAEETQVDVSGFDDLDEETVTNADLLSLSAVMPGWLYERFLKCVPNRVARHWEMLAPYYPAEMAEQLDAWHTKQIESAEFFMHDSQRQGRTLPCACAERSCWCEKTDAAHYANGECTQKNPGPFWRDVQRWPAPSREERELYE